VNYNSSIIITLPARENVSNETERDTTFIVKKALEQYLLEYIDYQIALDRLRDKDDKLISAEEMWRRLGV